MKRLPFALAIVVLAAVASALPFGADPRTSGFILAAANTGGGGNTFWKTDLWIHNPGRDAATVGFWILPAGRPGDAGTSVGILRVEPGETAEVHNVLGSFLGSVEPVAALEYRVLSGPDIFVQSRTYSGNADSPALPASDPSEAGSAADPLVIEGVHRGAGFRTNLSLVNPTRTDVTVAVRVIDTADRSRDLTTVRLPARSYLALNDVLAEFGETVREARLLVQPVADGRIFALASVVEGSGQADLRPADRSNRMTP